MEKKPKPKPRTRRYEKSTNHVEINDDTRAALSCNTSPRLLPGVGDILHEVKNLKKQLTSVKEERDELKEEVRFLKYQLAYRAQVQDLQKEMSEKASEDAKSKKTKSVRFAASVAVNDRHPSEDETDDCTDGSYLNESKEEIDSSFDMEEYERLRTQADELQDVLYDFYHDSKMAGKNGEILVGDIESHPSESISSLICRVLVNFDKLCEQYQILVEEKSKLDEDKVQLTNSMAKLREQFHDAVDSNIEEIEDLNYENEKLREQVKTLGGKNDEVGSVLIKAREEYVNRLKATIDMSKNSESDKLLQRLKNDSLLANIELKEAKELVKKVEEDKSNKLKRVQSLPLNLKQEFSEPTERGGLLSELRTCKNLQESQRKQISKILDEKLDLETQVSELKREVVLLKAERRVNAKTKSKLSQTDDGSETMVYDEPGTEQVSKAQVENLAQRCKDLEQKLKQAAQGNLIEDKNLKPSGDELGNLTRRCKDLEQKLEKVKREKLVVDQEKTSLLLSLDANIEKKDALEAQLAALQEKGGQGKVVHTNAAFTQTDGSLAKVEKSRSETGGGFQAGYKGISEAKVELEKIRVHEQDKQIAMLTRENEAVKEKLKKAESMSETLQTCLKDLTDEKLELLDSIEELNEEKAELEEARSKLEKQLGGERQEKVVADEVNDIRNKERIVGDSLEAHKAKLVQVNVKVLEVLTLIDSGTGNKETKSNPNKSIEDMIGFLLSSVENLKDIVISFKTAHEKTKEDGLRTKNELEAFKREKTELQDQVTNLTKRNKEIAASLESVKTNQKSQDLAVERLKKENARLDKELGGVRATKTGYEKSLAESRRREEDLRKQIKNVSNKRDDVQKAFDQLANQSTGTSALLGASAKEIEAFRSENKKLTTEVEQLREELEGTVEDRDELLELLDRIVCENGTGDEKQGLGLKVERIRERSKSDEHLPGVVVAESGKTQPVVEKLVVSSEMRMEHAASGENELFEEKGKIENDDKGVAALQEENQKLKEMVAKMLNDQKKMEAVLNSLSEANAEVKQDLEKSLEHTEQIRLQGSENCDSQDSVPDVLVTTSDENAELRRLHDAMVGTNEALSANLRRLHDGKTRSEQLRNSFQDVNEKNAALEKSIEGFAKDKESTEKEILNLKKKLKDAETETRREKNEKLDIERMLEENNGRVKDLKFQIDSLTEINQDLRETNEKLSGSSKENEKKWSKLNDKFHELECQNEDLKKAKKLLEKELVEHGKQKTEVEKELAERENQKAGLELELEKSKETISSLQTEITNHTRKGREMEESLGTSERELKLLRETAGKVTQLEQDARVADELRTAMEDVKKTLSEREERVAELESNVTRLKKEIQNSQRFVKAVSQENDTLRDSLSEWEREASKIRRHVHELSQDAENHNHSEGTKKDSKSQDVDKVKSVKAFEAMQVEMDAINKHLKAQTTENQELKAKLDILTKENAATRDRNIELLTRYDMVNKELEKKTSEVNKLNKDGKDSRSKKNNEKHEKEKQSLQTKIDKLDLENKLLKSSLTNTLNEEKRLEESLKNLIDGKKVQRQNGGFIKKDVVSEEYEIRTEISGLATTKPDLIRDSTEVKDEYMIVEQRKYKSELSAVENSGTEADIKELLADLLEGQMHLKGYCYEVSKFVKEKDSTNLKDEIDGSDTSKAELEKANELNKDLESSLERKEDELDKTREEKAKLEGELASIKEKCEKLQAVFRALILLMNDKKSGEKKGEEPEGPTRIIDYIKGIKTKYSTMVSEKETLESKVSDLEKEIEEHKARVAMLEEKRTKDGNKKAEQNQNKNISEDKERILNELLLSTARNKTRLLEELQELFDEYLKVKSMLDKEVESQEKDSNLVKITQEFSQSVMHTERFIQSVAHDRPVTVVVDSADEKDPNLELAKENEELIGRISAIKSSRRREAKNYKDELTKVEKDKVEAVKAEETKWKDEMEKMKGELEKKMKEKEQAANEVKNTLKQEVSQLKLDIRRISDEHDVAQRTARNEARLAAEKLEDKIKLLKAEMENKLAEKDSKMTEIKRKADADVKESAQTSEREISKVRANWADAERKLRVASEEKIKTGRELDRVKQEQSEEGTRSARELQKLKVALESTQKQATEREDGLRKEKDRLQRNITSLEGQMRNSEVTGRERTQAKMNEFQRSLDELAKQNQQLETARRNAEQSLGTENERLRFENARLQRELWEHNQKRKTSGSNEVQRRRDPNAPSGGERVKVMGTVRQSPVEKPRVVTPVESAPGPFPGPKAQTPGVAGSFPGDPQRRTVKVRESQATSVHVTRVQDQSVRRSSDPRDTVADELGAMFKEINNNPEWMDQSHSTVIHARPMQARAQVQPLPQKQAPPPAQKPQPEWEIRQDKTWPMQKSSHRHPPKNTRQKDPPPVRPHPQPQRTTHNNDDSRQRPGYTSSKPITRQTQGSLETEVTLSDARRAVEIKKLPEKETSRPVMFPRRPSVGSDDVFITNKANANTNLTSHGSKTGEFWRSRSLEDLLITDDRTTKQSEHHVVRGPHQKIPKSYSGPRKGEPRMAEPPGRGTGNQSAARKVTGLKGMENILFQSQI